MPSPFLSFNRVTHTFDSQGEPLFAESTFSLSRGWTGVIGPNGAGKTTLLLLACGSLAPISGSVERPDHVAYCSQRTETPPDDLRDILQTTEPPAPRLRGVLGLGLDWASRWETLSHGERKRAQVACALYGEPELLALDEPTNHVDAETRRFLKEALQRYRGIGLLVSHDRELLDALCRTCVVLDPSRSPLQRLTVRPGDSTEASHAASAEADQMRAVLEEARAREHALAAEARQRRREAEWSRARLSKRRLARGDHDAKGRIDMARITAKDRSAARWVRELETRHARATEEAQSITIRKRYDLGLWFASESSRRDTLFVRPAGALPLGGERKLTHPELVVAPRDRVALCGPNGSGKSTLVKDIVAHLTFPLDRLVYMPQEMDQEASARVADELHSLPPEMRGRALTVVNLLGSDPQRILASVSLSPGEVRKVLLAMGLARVPLLVVMDEPTNHLDLPSIECLGQALAQCCCALLLVSHDQRFLAPLCTRRWEITREAEFSTLLEAG